MLTSFSRFSFISGFNINSKYFTLPKVLVEYGIVFVKISINSGNEFTTIPEFSVIFLPVKGIFVLDPSR